MEEEGGDGRCFPKTAVIFELGLEDRVGVYHTGRERGSGKGEKNIPDEGKNTAEESTLAVCCL